MIAAEDGRSPIHDQGFSYLPHFISIAESEELIAFFASLHPLWEQRHHAKQAKRAEGSVDGSTRRLTRPVYWLGAWQFASLGYYAEPDYREHRCLRAEPFPKVMSDILERLVAELTEYHEQPALPNTCLINYYGREVGLGVPRDYARLRMHRDGEPGPVIMFNIGQAGLLEFLDPDKSPDPELRLWNRHRAVTIISGPEYKDRLYHRVVQVRTGSKPEMQCVLDNFELRRVSVSFRHVPEDLIEDMHELPEASQDIISPYVDSLAQKSTHFRAQLQRSSD